jgi:hypothetical protein
MPDTPPLPRDVRVDHLGLVGELVRQFAEPLKARVKASMDERETDRVEGDRFEALLVAGGVVQTIDPAKFLRLYERKLITRAQLLSALRVSADPAGEFLSRADIEKISEFKPSAAQLRVKRKAGVEVGLVEAVRSLAAAVEPG